MQQKSEFLENENKVTLPNLAVLDICDNNTLYHGGNQDWYVEHWQQEAGCGPTTCANLLWYLAQTDKNCRALWVHEASNKAGFIELMQEMWQHVTPSSMGVNTTDIFVDGAINFAKSRGVSLAAKTAQISPKYCSGQNYSDSLLFVRQALENGLPVAFLNLSNGLLINLDSWHWVCIVALRGDQVQIYDQGEAKWINLRRWHTSTLMGGGFVTIEAGS